ncbi:MAG: hypothetical protein GY863_21120 [bacterium]|nr:hypothetical protein [bacterium]
MEFCTAIVIALRLDCTICRDPLSENTLKVRAFSLVIVLSDTFNAWLSAAGLFLYSLISNTRAINRKK